MKLDALIEIPLFIPLLQLMIISLSQYHVHTYHDIVALCQMNIIRYSLDEDHDKDRITISPQ